MTLMIVEEHMLGEVMKSNGRGKVTVSEVVTNRGEFLDIRNWYKTQNSDVWMKGKGCWISTDIVQGLLEILIKEDWSKMSGN